MASAQQFGAFVPTSQVWDIAQIQDVDVTSPEFKNILIRLYQNLNLMALVLNVKDTGYYNTQEYVSGRQLFPNPALSSSTPQYPAFRPICRMTVNFGALPNTATKSVPHNIQGINSQFVFTHIYATASDPVNLIYLPIPYASTTGDDIELNVDSTNVNITTISDRTLFTQCVVVLEYVRF